MALPLSFITMTAGAFGGPLALAELSPAAAAIMGAVASLFLNWVVVGLITLVRDYKDRAARRKRDAEYEELRRKYPAAAKAVDELFDTRLPSLSGK